MDGKQRRRAALHIIPAALLALAVVAAVIAVVLSTTGKMTPQKLLEKYYNARYTERGGGFEAVLECVNPFLREDYRMQATADGADPCAEWREEARSYVGDGVSLKLDILDTYEQGSQTYVVFRLTMTGSEGSKPFMGSAPLTQEGDKWYLSSYIANIAPEEAE